MSDRGTGDKQEEGAPFRDRIVLIGCGKEKAPERCVAREMYRGPLFRDRLAYADAVDVPMFILSAAYGLVDPERVYEPYDKRLDELSPIERAAWYTVTAGMLFDELPDDTVPGGITIELHAGADYADPLSEILTACGFQTTRPVRGLGIGAQRGWYADAIRKLELGLGVRHVA